MKAYLNNILLDWVKVGAKSQNSSVTTHNIDDNSADSIASHVSNDFMTFSIQANLQGDDRETRLEKLKEIRKKKQLAVFSYDELIDKLVITNISDEKIGINTIQVDISFTQIQFATVKREEKPQPELKTTVAKKKNTGKQGTTPKKVTKKTVTKKTVTKKRIGGQLSN